MTRGAHIGSASVPRVDAREFERLYRESFPKVYTYVRFRVTDEAAAQDITSESYLRAIRYLTNFDPARASFATWVRSIARNCINDYFAKMPPTIPVDEIAPLILSADTDHDMVGDRELCLQLIGALDDRDRELVHLKYFCGMRNVEIARELHMNESTVATRLQRALLRMRAEAERTGIFEP